MHDRTLIYDGDLDKTRVATGQAGSAEHQQHENRERCPTFTPSEHDANETVRSTARPTLPFRPLLRSALVHSRVFRSRMRAVKTTPVWSLCRVRGKASTFHTHSSPFRGRFKRPR